MPPQRGDRNETATPRTPTKRSPTDGTGWREKTYTRRSAIEARHLPRPPAPMVGAEGREPAAGL